MEGPSRDIEKGGAQEGEDDKKNREDAKIGAMALRAGVPGEVEHNSDLTAKANAFLRRYGRGLALFSKDSKLTFVPSKTAETFSFSPDDMRVNTPLSWFASENYGDDELSFANHHEIAHFIDMHKNPEAYLENFEYLERRAEKLAKNYLAKHPDKASLDAVKSFYYNELHSLYNVLDDICVNNLVFQRNKFFDSGDGRKDVESLYEKLGFEKTDLTDQPLHTQMIISLLRDEMLGENHDKSIVDERVEAVLSKKKLGKTIRETIDMDLKPRQGILADPSERYKIIRTLIEPEYLELLEVALEEQEQKNEQNQNENQDDEQDGEGNSRQDEFNPFGDKKKQASDILDHGENGDQVMKDILESFEEKNKIDKMSPEEREKYQNQKRVQAFDKNHGITSEERAESEQIKATISRARDEMRKFWHRLIGKSIEYQQIRVHEQRRGRLNVGSFIKKYPEAIESERNGNLRSLEIYDRNGLERKIADRPETIDVSLLVDCSGSMDSKKIKAAKEAVALLMYSIKDFNQELERTRRETHSKLHANTQVIVFGSASEEIKPFDNDGNGLRRIAGNENEGNLSNANEAAIIKSISEINDNRGSTDDAMPLGDILSGLTSEERTKIKQGRLKKIVFEITDGQPDDPALTSERLTELAEAGVVVIGFQIGYVSENERNVFQSIWNNDQEGGNKRGIFIGTEIDKLPGSLMDELSELLNDIMI